MACQGTDLTCDRSFWKVMITHHQIGIDLLTRFLQSRQADPSLAPLLRNMQRTFEQNAHQMIFALKGKSDLMVISAPEPSVSCQPRTSLEYYTNPVCGPVPECTPQCRKDLQDPEQAKHIAWKCTQEFLSILVEHQAQGIAWCEAKRKLTSRPFVLASIYDMIAFMKKNMFDLLALLKQHCTYVHYSPLLKNHL